MGNGVNGREIETVSAWTAASTGPATPSTTAREDYWDHFGSGVDFPECTEERYVDRTAG
jgi:hypothetical protein